MGHSCSIHLHITPTRFPRAILRDKHHLSTTSSRRGFRQLGLLHTITRLPQMSDLTEGWASKSLPHTVISTPVISRTPPLGCRSVCKTSPNLRRYLDHAGKSKFHHNLGVATGPRLSRSSSVTSYRMKGIHHVRSGQYSCQKNYMVLTLLFPLLMQLSCLPERQAISQ